MSRFPTPTPKVSPVKQTVGELLIVLVTMTIIAAICVIGLMFFVRPFLMAISGE